MTQPPEATADPNESAHVADVSQLARGGALNLFGALFAAAAGFVLYAILGRLLGAQGAGAFIVTIAVFHILAIAGTIGTDTGLIREISRVLSLNRASEVRPILIIGLLPVAVVGVGFAALIWFGADTLAATFGDDSSQADIASYLRVLAPFVPVASVYLAILGATRGFSTMIPTAVVDRMGRAGSQPILVWIAIGAGMGATATAVAWAAPYAVGLVAAGIWLGFLLRRWLRRHPDGLAPVRSVRKMAKDFWTFTLPRSLAAIFRVAVQWIDVLIVSAILSPREAGIYAVSTRLLQLGLFVASSVGQVAQPMFSSLLAEGHHRRTGTVYQTATGWLVAITWPQYLAVAIFAPLLLSIFGAEFTEGATVVAILAVSTMIGAAAGPVDMLLLMAGKSTWSLWNTSITLATNVALNLLLIPELGIEGAAISWAVSRVVANALPLFQVGRYLDFHPWGPGARHAAAASLLIFGGVGIAARVIGGTTWPAFLAFSVVSLAAYGWFLHRYRDELDLPLAWQSFRSRGRNRTRT